MGQGPYQGHQVNPTPLPNHNNILQNINHRPAKVKIGHDVDCNAFNEVQSDLNEDNVVAAVLAVLLGLQLLSLVQLLKEDTGVAETAPAVKILLYCSRRCCKWCNFVINDKVIITAATRVNSDDNLALNISFMAFGTFCIC